MLLDLPPGGLGGRAGGRSVILPIFLRALEEAGVVVVVGQEGLEFGLELDVRGFLGDVPPMKQAGRVGGLRRCPRGILRGGPPIEIAGGLGGRSAILEAARKAVLFEPAPSRLDLASSLLEIAP
jgi:hypothetical protein